MSIATQQTVLHDTFSITRDYAYSPEFVFSAWSSEASKRVWFADNDAWENIEYSMDFRVGGREYDHSIFKNDGMVSQYDARYEDIILNKRIVVAYTMTINGERISSSLLTLEFIDRPTADNREATQLRVTEQLAMLDGKEQTESRRGGWEWIIGNLATELQKRSRH